MEHDASERLGSTDRTFVDEATQANLSEIQAARLALQKSSNPLVQALAQRMLDDHTSANNQLKSLAQQNGWQLPNQPSAEQQRAYQELSSKTGSAFDSAYLNEATKDHRQVISQFEAQAQHGTNAALRNYANQTLPALRSHLTIAQRALQSIGAASPPQK